MPVPVPVVVQFIVDHAARTAAAHSKAGLVSELPPDIDQALVANGYKTRLGAPALNTLVHRIAVLAKAPNPCADPLVRELLAQTRRAYAKGGARPRKQRALTKDPLQAVLATCDDTLRGKRDRALLRTGDRRATALRGRLGRRLENYARGSGWPR